VIGDWLTEVNVTSPTCIVEIAEQTGTTPPRLDGRVWAPDADPRDE
jgi:glutathione synthase/RimK-type ligase-like ATP-grasp enzyme